jgi:hypothetical protein
MAKRNKKRSAADQKQNLLAVNFPADCLWHSLIEKSGHRIS